MGAAVRTDSRLLLLQTRLPTIGGDRTAPPHELPTMDQQLRRGFQIGAFEIEPLTGRIAGPSGETRVQPKVMDVLVFLAQHAGELVERDMLLDQVWKRVSSEEVLTRCISELRAALGDDRGSPHYIQTVPKRGYRLLERAVAKDAGTYGVRELATRPTRPPTHRCARRRRAPRWRRSPCCRSKLTPWTRHTSSSATHLQPSCRALWRA